MDDRLRDIESGLSRLANMLMANGSANSVLNESSRPACDTDLTSEEDHNSLQLHSLDQGDEQSASSPTDRHIVRSNDNNDLLDRYYGPCTLFSLCSEFRQDPRLEQKIENAKTTDPLCNRDELDSLIRTLCSEAIESPLSLPEEVIPMAIRLPPKQFLTMVHTQFFNLDDYRTNIFIQSSFLANVNRLYRTPYNPADEAWAVCFNTIILLVLGGTDTTCHGSDPLVESQFALPFRRTFGAAISNLSALMRPKLINVQTLALLVCLGLYFILFPSFANDMVFSERSCSEILPF